MGYILWRGSGSRALSRIFARPGRPLRAAWRVTPLPYRAQGRGIKSSRTPRPSLVWGARAASCAKEKWKDALGDYFCVRESNLGQGHVVNNIGHTHSAIRATSRPRLNRHLPLSSAAALTRPTRAAASTAACGIVRSLRALRAPLDATDPIELCSCIREGRRVRKCTSCSLYIELFCALSLACTLMRVRRRLALCSLVGVGVLTETKHSGGNSKGLQLGSLQCNHRLQYIILR